MLTSTLSPSKSRVPIQIEYVMGGGLGPWLGVGPEKIGTITQTTRTTIEERSTRNRREERKFGKFISSTPSD